MPEAPEKNSEENSESQEFNLRNKFSDYHQVVPVSGARGGNGPRGMLEFEFYTDRWTTPEAETFTVQGNLVSLPTQDAPRDMDRLHHFAAVMNHEVAVSIGLFMVSTATGVPKEVLRDALGQAQEHFQEVIAEEE